jgi:BA14K-like protein
MHKLKILTAAVTLLSITPVPAQEMGGATGPGRGGGFEPTYNRGYYSGYRVGGGALDANNSYALTPNDGSCAQRHRSYDPRSGSYVGSDRRRHPCLR